MKKIITVLFGLLLVSDVFAAERIIDVERATIGRGLNQMRYIVRPYYRLMPGLNFFVEYEHDYGAFKTMQVAQGDPSIINTVTFSLVLLL